MDPATEALILGMVTTVARSMIVPLTQAVTQLANHVGKLDQCVIYACPEGSHGLNPANQGKQWLQRILGLATDAEVAAFIAAAYQHPVTTSATFAAAAGGIYTAGKDSLDELLSLAGSVGI